MDNERRTNMASSQACANDQRHTRAMVDLGKASRCTETQEDTSGRNPVSERQTVATRCRRLLSSRESGNRWHRRRWRYQRRQPRIPIVNNLSRCASVRTRWTSAHSDRGRMNNISQMDLEAEMLRICTRMETDIELLLQLSTERAEAESSYRYKHARAIFEQEGKIPVATKDAVAHLRAADEFRQWQLLTGREKATQQSLIASRSRLDAMRTICANVRAVGG